MPRQPISSQIRILSLDHTEKAMPISSVKGAELAAKEKILLLPKRPSESFSDDTDLLAKRVKIAPFPEGHSQKQASISDVQIRHPKQDQVSDDVFRPRPAKRVSFLEVPRQKRVYVPIMKSPWTNQKAHTNKTLQELAATVPRPSGEELNWDEICAKWKEAADATLSKTTDAPPSPVQYPDTPFWKSNLDEMERRRKATYDQYAEYEKSRMCDICLKTNDHFPVRCPYLTYYPEGEPVGPNVELVCIGPGSLDEDPAGRLRRAVRKSCFLCAAPDHWSVDCPLAKRPTNA
ncbi:hypothetical protein OROMI_020385 [Orobanche minor]